MSPMSLLSGTSRAVAVNAPSQDSSRRLRLEKTVVIVSFLLLPAVIYFWLVLLPVIHAIYFSFYKWNGLGPLQDFIGLDNYRRLLNDGVFLRALTNNLVIVVLSAAVQLPLALALAL